MDTTSMSSASMALATFPTAVQPIKKPYLLQIPLEIRLQIYEYLLVLPRGTRHLSRRRRVPASVSDEDMLFPAILRVCTQTHDEAAPLLYSHNTFLAHTTLLTSLPRLRAWHTPVNAVSTHHNPAGSVIPPRDLISSGSTSPPAPGPVVPHLSPRAPLRRIRRWWVRVRLDADPAWDRAAVARHLSGADEVVIEVWQAVFLGAGVSCLRRFEGVRGVRRVRVFGSVHGYEGYARWLKRAMASAPGARVPAYVPADDKERKRLDGWCTSPSAAKSWSSPVEAEMPTSVAPLPTVVRPPVEIPDPEAAPEVELRRQLSEMMEGVEMAGPMASVREQLPTGTEMEVDGPEKKPLAVPNKSTTTVSRVGKMVVNMALDFSRSMNEFATLLMG